MKSKYRNDSVRMAGQLLKAAARASEKGEKIFVFPHRSVDGDCIGSACSIASILRGLGADAYVAMPEKLPENMGFLNVEDLLAYPTLSPDDREFGIAVAVDCSEGNRMGQNEQLFDSCSDKLIIDHHASVKAKGENMWVMPEASSASELCYYVAVALAEETGRDISEIIDKRTAECLLTGVVTDTGRFTYRNTSPETLTVAGELMELGADVAIICYYLFDRKMPNEFYISNAACSNAELFYDGKLAITAVPDEMFTQYNAGRDDIADVVSRLRDIDGVELAVVLREAEDGSVRGNLRSQETFDCSKFAESYGGGGHVRAAGFTVTGKDMTELKDEIIARVKDLL